MLDIFQNIVLQPLDAARSYEELDCGGGAKAAIDSPFRPLWHTPPLNFQNFKPQAPYEFNCYT